MFLSGKVESSTGFLMILALYRAINIKIDHCKGREGTNLYLLNCPLP